MAVTTGANRYLETPPHGDRVQPHGALIAIDDASLTIGQTSTNAARMLGLPWEAIAGRTVAGCFQDTTLGFWESLQTLAEGRFYRCNLATTAGQLLHATVHRPPSNFRGTVILEVEPLAAICPSLETHRDTLRTALARLQRATDCEDLLQAATGELQQLTGCDRVMVYRFDTTGAGAVVAESRSLAAGEPYLGLHYPAEDIPAAARVAYQHCPLRYIPDFGAAPATLSPSEPLDLDWSLLRYPSDCCREYHANMGTAALLVLPLLQSGQLWGLISCHHRQPRYLAPEVRADCELLAQFLALELADRRHQEERAYERQLQVLRADIVAELASTRDPQATLTASEPRLLGLAGATGAATCWGGKISLVGRTPSRAAVRDLLTWAETGLEREENLLATHTLPASYPQAAAFSDAASGLLLLQISRLRHWAILWFRPEVPRTVDWAGDPRGSANPAIVATGPRTSFARWREIQRGSARPWHPAELASARELRNAIVSFVLHRTDELERLNRELARSNQELASFAFAASHDLKEPLRGIHNYAIFLLEDYATRLDAAGRERLQVLVNLSQRMENLIDVLLYYSRLGQAELETESTDLDDLVAREIELLSLSRPQVSPEFRRPRPLPTLCCDPTLVRELFGNLIGNAWKYNDKAKPWIEIGYLSPTEQARQFPQRDPQLPVLLYVRDNGIGIRDRHQQAIFRLFKRLHARDRYGGGAGAGLAIVQRIIERHGGQIWVESTYGEGATFYFSLGSERDPYKT